MVVYTVIYIPVPKPPPYKGWLLSSDEEGCLGRIKRYIKRCAYTLIVGLFPVLEITIHINLPRVLFLCFIQWALGAAKK